MDDLLNSWHEHLVELLAATHGEDEGPADFLNILSVQFVQICHYVLLNIAEKEWWAEARYRKAACATSKLIDGHLIKAFQEQGFQLYEKFGELARDFRVGLEDLDEVERGDSVIQSNRQIFLEFTEEVDGSSMHLVVRVVYVYDVFCVTVIKHAGTILEFEKVVEVAGAFTLVREVCQQFYITFFCK